MKELKGRVAVVTGAASGIGFALANRFAVEGMRVVMSDIDGMALRDAAGRVSESGAAVTAVRADVSRAEDVENLACQAFRAFGAVHVLCNNAGVGVSGLISENSLRDWEWVIGVNVWGVIHGLRSFLPRMIEQDAEGHIVNTASIAGIITGPGMGVYCASKHAVVSLSESLYHELSLTGSKSPRISGERPKIVASLGAIVRKLGANRRFERHIGRCRRERGRRRDPREPFLHPHPLRDERVDSPSNGEHLGRNQSAIGAGARPFRPGGGNGMTGLGRVLEGGLWRPDLKFVAHIEN